VIATGISNGGIFTEVLGCSLADRLIGIVPVAGLMRRDTAAGCKPAKQISVFGIHGVDDPIASYGGVAGADGFLSFPETLAFWAKVDGCSKSPASGHLPDTAHDKTTVSTISYSQCALGTDVSGYAVKGGGHAWPGGEAIGVVDDVGVTSGQFDASEMIWSFLDRHRRAGEA
jgi:polyhydroxybutyrate depolymerase